MLGATMIALFSDMLNCMGATMIALFSDMLNCNCGFSSVIVFGFGYCAVKFAISFVVIIKIIRNVIVSWMCYW